jgi:hypothetical protein
VYNGFGGSLRLANDRLANRAGGGVPSHGTAAAEDKNMRNASTLPNPLRAQEIHPAEWNAFSVEFTRQYRGAHARLEIVGPDTDIGYQVEVENQPFDGVAADTRGHERTVWMTFSPRSSHHVAHGIRNAAKVRILDRGQHAGPVLEVESDDGTQSILELSKPFQYALLPGKV